MASKQGLQQTFINIPLTGLREQVATELAEAVPGLSVCENLQFLQKSSPTFRPGYREATAASSIDDDYTTSCLLLRGTPHCVTETEVRHLVPSSGPPYDTKITPVYDASVSATGSWTLNSWSGLTRCSPSLLATVPAPKGNYRESGIHTVGSSRYDESITDIYYYPDASGSTQGLAVIAVAPTQTKDQTSSSNIVSQVSVYLMDVGSGTIIGRSQVPTMIDGTVGFVANMKLAGWRDTLMVIIGGTRSITSGTYGQDLVVWTVGVSVDGFGTWASTTYSGVFLNSSTKPGLLSVDYDRSHGALTGNRGNIYAAYHTTSSSGAGEVIQVRRLNVAGTTQAVVDVTTGAAPGAGLVRGFGISAYNTYNEEVVLAYWTGSVTEVKSYQDNSLGSLIASARGSTFTGATTDFLACNNAVIYMTPTTISPAWDGEVIIPSGMRSFGLLMARCDGRIAVTSPAEVHVGYLAVGRNASDDLSSDSTGGIVPQPIVYVATTLVAEPFTVNRDGILYAVLPTSPQLVTTEPAPDFHVSLVAFRTWPNRSSTAAGGVATPPHRPCETVVAHLATGIYTPSPDRSFSNPPEYSSHRLPACVQASDGSFTLMSVPIADNTSFSSGGFRPCPQSYAVYKLDHTCKFKSSLPTGFGPMFSCGYPMSLDGGRVVEAAFPRTPIAGARHSVSSSGTTVPAARQYKLMWEYETTTGHVMWSPLSSPLTGGLADDAVTMKAYLPRSRAVRPGSGSRLLAFGSDDAATDRFITAIGLNDSTPFTAGIGYALYTDIWSPSGLASNQTPYYNPRTVGSGGPLPRQRAASLRYLTLHKDRLFGVDENHRVRFTGPYVPGEFPWWSDAFTLSYPGEEPPTGLASLEGRLLLFTRNATFAIDGEGPPEGGGNGSEFSQPQKVAPIGCVDGRSIVETPYGVFYRSFRGFELVNGSGRTTFVGEDAQKTTKAYPTTVAAAYDPAADCVKFLCSNSEEPAGGYVAGTAGGAILCYYIKSQAWAVHRIPVEESDQGGSNFSDMVCLDLGNGPVTVLSSADGRIFIERAGDEGSQLLYVDPDSGPVTAKMATQDIRLGGASNSRQRFYQAELAALFGRRYDATMRLYYNYSSVSGNDATCKAEDMEDSMGFIQASPDKQQLHAIRVEAEFTVPSNITFTSDGTVEPTAVYPVPPKPLQLALKIGVQPGFPRIGESNKI